MALQPTTIINVALNAEQWNTVLSLLGETGPYRVVNPLIAAIMQQCMAADSDDPDPGTGLEVPHKLNGGVSPPLSRAA